jgi:4-amino-4-deoxy-L-arabinose transferase-like glycosyltransferase
LLLAETWAALTAALTVLATYRLLRSQTGANAAMAGAAAALAMLSRSELALLVPLAVLPAILVYGPGARGRRLRLSGVTLIAAGLVVSPWVLYNLSRFAEPVLLSDGDGGVLLGANCDTTYSGRLIGFWNGFCGLDQIAPSPDDSVEAARKRAVAFEYIGDHLGRLPVVMAARVGRTWSLYRPAQMAEISRSEGRPYWVSYSGLAAYALLVVLSGFGLVALRRRRVALIPLVGPLVMVTVNAMVFYGLVRFRIGAEPSLVLLAAVGACSLAPPGFPASTEPGVLQRG